MESSTKYSLVELKTTISAWLQRQGWVQRDTPERPLNKEFFSKPDHKDMVLTVTGNYRDKVRFGFQYEKGAKYSTTIKEDSTDRALDNFKRRCVKVMDTSYEKGLADTMTNKLDDIRRKHRADTVRKALWYIRITKNAEIQDSDSIDKKYYYVLNPCNIFNKDLDYDAIGYSVGESHLLVFNNQADFEQSWVDMMVENTDLTEDELTSDKFYELLEDIDYDQIPKGGNHFLRERSQMALKMDFSLQQKSNWNLRYGTEFEYKHLSGKGAVEQGLEGEELKKASLKGKGMTVRFEGLMQYHSTGYSYNRRSNYVDAPMWLDEIKFAQIFDAVDATIGSILSLSVLAKVAMQNRKKRDYALLEQEMGKEAYDARVKEYVDGGLAF